MKKIFAIISLLSLIALECFTASIDDYKQKLILGGRPAKPGEFPYQVSLRKDGYHWCGGSILTSQWVLTAAHCTHRIIPSVFSVYYGSNHITEGGLEVRVKSVYNHPLFNSKLYTNDIALLKLEKPLCLSKLAQPVTLSLEPDVPPGFNVTVTGWGYLKDGAGCYPELLQVAQIPVVEREVCKKLYARGNLHPNNDMFCAGDINKGGLDACKGDSGGPAVLAGVQVGIVSWGYKCGDPRHPGVYTLVSHFVPWVNRTINSS
ncbi:NFU1 iron-sulfur cluster scaffold [Sarcoptes scabiei]|nr:NFU1 iron-sulfur cluster scaffold [Sarcoptes scabiei]